MKKTNIAKTILLIATLALMQIATNAQKAELVVQTGHSDSVLSTAFSTDMRFILTGGADRLACIWERQTGKQIRCFEGHKGIVTAVAFSHDGQFILTGSGDIRTNKLTLEIRLWRTATGELLQKHEVSSSLIHTVAFSPDDRLFSSSGYCDTVSRSVHVWNTQSGNEIWQSEKSDQHIAFSNNSKYLLASGCNNVATLFDAENGSVLRHFPNKETKEEIQKISDISDSSDFTFVKFTDDDKLAILGKENGFIQFWNIESGKQERVFKQDGSIISLSISSENNQLISISSKQQINIWDLNSDSQVPKTIIPLESDLPISKATFSPNNKYVLALSLELISGSRLKDYRVQLSNVETGKRERFYEGSASEVTSAKFSDDGKFIVTANAYSSLSETRNNFSALWDLNTGQQTQTFQGHTAYIWTAELTQDNKFLLTSSIDKTTRLWDAKSGKEVIKLNSSTTNVVAISSDGKFIITSGLYVPEKQNPQDLNQSGLGIHLWNADTGQELSYLVPQELKEIKPYAITVSSNNKIAAIVDDVGRIYVWDLQNGNLIAKQEFLRLRDTKRVNDYSYEAVKFFPDNSKLLLGSGGGHLIVWSFSINQFEELADVEEPISDLSFSPNGKQVLLTIGTRQGWTGTTSNKVILWDIESNKYVREFVGHTNSVFLANFSPNGRFVLTGSWDGTSRIWDAITGKQLCKLITLRNGEWVVIDPDGRFDASPGAQKLMHFVVGLEPVDLEQIKDRYYTPNLLQRIFKGENLDQSRKVSVFTADELYPLTEYAPLKAGETSLTVKLKNRGGGIGRVQVFVNGAEFSADARPKGFDPKSKTGEFKIDFSSAKTLKKGESNNIKIIARNEAGWLRNRGTEIVYLDGGKKNDTPQEFYAIIGGVSEYENNSLNLSYSAKDARDFAKATELGAVKLFGKDRVHIRLLASGTENSELTGADSKLLAPSKENFRRTFEEFRKAKPTDVFVVYLAGHGTSINKGGDTGDTYLYLTQEAVTTDKSRLLDEKLRGATTVSSEELAEWIKDVPALKRAMILDTCAAGAVEASLIKARDLSPDQIKALDRMKDRTGFYVLMGSAADAQSYEATRYGQGLLTYSLLQGMSGAKLREGEYADVNLLFGYAADEVVEMAKGIGGIQQPRIIAPTESRSFDIGRFSTVEKGKFTLAKVKPLILQPQLSNDKLKFDNLKLSQMVAKALRDESSTVSRGGAEAKLVFVEADEMNDAITPGGVYEVSGEQIKVTLVLVRNNEPVKTVTVEGTAADKEELGRKIVKAIIENAS